MIRTSDVLDRIRPNSVWALKADDLSTIRWIENDKDGKGLPTEKEVEDTKVIMQAEYDAQAYARDRATSYPSVGDQLDMLMKDMRDGTTTHQEACEAVKDKFPKP